MRRSWWLLGCLLIAACGGDEATSPMAPEGFDPASAASSKADSLTKWYTTAKGALTVGTDLKGKTGATEWFHGYTVKLAAGDKVTLKATGSDWGLVAAYGPQKKNGQYGSPVALAWIVQPLKGGYQGALTLSAAQAGVYLVVVGSPWDSGYSYTLSSSCLAGSCQQRFCLEYETVDDAGVPLRNFYAINATYAEAQAELALVPTAINTKVSAGSCASQSKVCATLAAQQVCGEPAGGLPSATYGSVCAFKVEIRQLAGETDQAKGHWDPGACGAPHCVVWEATNGAGGSGQAFYAENVGSYQEGKDRLAQIGQFLDEHIYVGTCASQNLACIEIYKPVCADTPTTTAKTFANLCFFKNEVIALAGETGTHKGKWNDGACVCDPQQEWWRSYTLTDPAKCMVAKFACPAQTSHFSSECGCGCEQDASCPEWINCMPPVTQSCTDLKAKCPYSKIAY